MLRLPKMRHPMMMPQVKKKKEAKDIPQVRQSATDRLKQIAESVEHKLSHLPKNPFCQSCIMGKMKEKYSHRRTFAR